MSTTSIRRKTRKYARTLNTNANEVSSMITTKETMHPRPLKKRSFDFWRCTCFSHHLVHLMPIGTMFSEIDQYLDLLHRLWSFRVLVHTLTLAGMGDYTLGWSCLYNFSKTPGLTPLSDAVFNADHDKIIKIYISQKLGGAGILCAIIALVAKKIKTCKW